MSKKEINQRLHNLNILADKILNLPFEQLQTFRSLHELPLNQEIHINGTTNVKFFQNDQEIHFKTIIPPGISFPLHWHNCFERCKVLQGLMKDHIIVSIHATQGSSVYYDKYEPHQAYNGGDSDLILHVVFRLQPFSA